MERIGQRYCQRSFKQVGKTQPPIFVGSEKENREIAIDYGKVWK